MKLSDLYGKASDNAELTGTQSQALQPIVIVLGELLLAFVLACFANYAAWVVIAMLVLSTITLVFFLVVYVFFLVHDRSALRTETYWLTKLTPPKDLTGDKDQPSGSE
ncbi:MAG TPA: hypothetical protein VGK19_18510 [Capsulimonadaceae bacterium]|jgi:hypothetical protein